MLYHDPANETSTQLIFSKYQCEDFEDNCPLENLHQFCEGCRAALGITESPQKFINITNNEIGKTFNVTLHTFLSDEVEKRMSQTTIIKIGKKPACFDPKNNLNQKWSVNHIYTQDQIISSSTPFPYQDIDCKIQLRCIDCYSESNVLAFEIDQLSKSLRVQTWGIPSLNQIQGKIEVWVNDQAAGIVQFTISLVESFSQNLINPKRQLQCMENMYWCSCFCGQIFYIYLGQGTVTFTFPKYCWNTACQPGSPEVVYMGPEGSWGDGECFQWQGPTYNAITQKWTCPNGFIMNTMQPNFVTDGYSLTINTNGPTLQIGVNYNFRIYYDPLNTAYISDYWTIQFKACVLTSIPNLVQMTPTTQSYTIGGTSIIINFPTFTQLPVTCIQLTYLIYVDGVLGPTFPAWFSYVANTTWTVITSNLAFVGTHNVTIKTTSTSPVGWFNIQTVILTFIDPCLTTTWNSNSILNLVTTIAASPSLVYTFTAYSVVCSVPSCGPVNYVLNPSKSFLALDTTLKTITVASSNVLDVGVYTETLTGTLANYPTVPAKVISFTVTINHCVSNNVMMSPTIQNYIIGGTAIIWNFPTFTQTSTCATYKKVSIFIDGLITYPAWFSQVANTTFTIYTATTSFAGVHNVTITTYWSPLSYTDTQTLILTFIDPCLTTTWNANSIPNLTTTVSLVPSLVYLYTAFTVVWTQISCGPVSYILSPSQTFLTLDTTFNKITVATTNPQDIGVYNEILTGTLINYPSVPAKIISFNVTINPCVIFSLAGTNNANSTAPITITIYGPVYYVQLATYAQTSICNYVPTITLDGDTAPIPTLYVAQIFWSKVNETFGQIVSVDYTLHGFQFTLRQTTKIGLFPNQYVTRIYQFEDPCWTTSLLNITLPNIDSSIFATPQIVTFPWLNDTISQSYTSPTSDPTCYLQNVSITENGGSIQYATLAANEWTVQTNLIAQAGEHIMNVTYQMIRYPNKFFNTSFTLRLFYIIAPANITNQTYEVIAQPNCFSSSLFTYIPLAVDMVLTHTVTLLNGLPLPPFITYTMDDTTITLCVSSQSAADVGNYTFQIKADLTPILGVGVNLTSSQTFGLKITPAPKVINFAPYFKQALTTSFDVNVGEAWSYTLPEVADAENQAVVTSVQLGTASLFTNFEGGSFNVISGKTTEALKGSYVIKITLTDADKGTGTFSITLNVKSNIPATVVTTTKTTDSNFGDQFANILQADKTIPVIPGKIYPDPTAKITTLDKLGGVQITFSEVMVEQKLSVIQNTTLVNSKQVPILEVLVKPGFYTDKDNLNFTYVIQSQTSRTIKIQLTFENPILISSLDDPDFLEIKFNGYKYFYSQYGKTIKENTVIKKNIPRQMMAGGLAETLAAVSETAGTASNALLASNMGFNLVLSASLQQLWSLIATQQIIVLMPLFAVNLPPNANYFFGFIMTIASFDILPTDSFYNDYFDMTESLPISDHFESLGFNSQYFLYNLGSLMIGLLSLPVLAIMVLLMKPFRTCSDKIHRWHNKLSRYLYWGHVITVFRESYTILVICSLINVTHVRFYYQFLQMNLNSKSDKVSTIFAIMIFTLCLVLPIMLSITLYKKFGYLMKPLVRAKWGILFEELKLSNGPRVILHVVHYFLRRLLLSVVIICQQYLIVQILTIHGAYIIQMVILGFVEPFKEPFKQKMEYFNEVVILGVLYCMMCFSDLIPDMIMQFNMGYVVIAVVSIHLCINLGFMMFANWSKLKLCCLRIKKQRALKIQRKIMAEQRILKAEITQQRIERTQIIEQIQTQLNQKNLHDQEAQNDLKQIQNYLVQQNQAETLQQKDPQTLGIQKDSQDLALKIEANQEVIQKLRKDKEQEALEQLADQIRNENIEQMRFENYKAIRQRQFSKIEASNQQEFENKQKIDKIRTEMQNELNDELEDLPVSNSQFIADSIKFRRQLEIRNKK